MDDKETTKTNMLMDLDAVLSCMTEDELLVAYNQMTGYDYSYDDIDWTE